MTKMMEFPMNSNCFCRLLENQRESCSQLSPSSIDTDKRWNVTMADKHCNAAALCFLHNWDTHHFLRQLKCATQCHEHKSILGQRAAPFTLCFHPPCLTGISESDRKISQQTLRYLLPDGTQCIDFLHTRVQFRHNVCVQSFFFFF